jgi:ferritin heavy chain
MNTNLSQVRQNFHAETETVINDQINMELYASYVYQSMAFYFDRDDVALPGFSKYFKHNSDEEREHAEKFMKYLNSRGGRVVLKDVKRPDNDEWGTGLNALQTVLNLEKQVNASLLSLHAVASTHNDPHLSNFLEEEFLTEQVESIKQLGDHVTKLIRAGPGLGEFLYDKELQSSN